VRRAFLTAHPCPLTGLIKGRCPGYVIDHVIPLACGGADAVENMHWMRLDEMRVKDRAALRECAVWISK
jgi:hypothetical protein